MVTLIFIKLHLKSWTLAIGKNYSWKVCETNQQVNYKNVNKHDQIFIVFIEVYDKTCRLLMW